MKVLLLWITPVFSYVPFCINCKHFKDDIVDKKYGTCKRFPIIYKDDFYLVTGNGNTKPVNYHYCSVARSTSRMCGEEGIEFEEIEIIGK
jgi:hypothetical protein